MSHRHLNIIQEKNNRYLWIFQLKNTKSTNLNNASKKLYVPDGPFQHSLMFSA